METKIDFPSENSDFRNNATFTRRVRRDLIIIFSFSLLAVITGVVCVFYSNKISHFFSMLLKGVILGTHLSNWLAFCVMWFSYLIIKSVMKTKKGKLIYLSFLNNKYVTQTTTKMKELISRFTPQWIKKYWKDPAFRAFTYGFTVIPIVWDALISLIDFKLFYGTSVLGLILLVVMYTVAYFKRNSA